MLKWHTSLMQSFVGVLSYLPVKYGASFRMMDYISDSIKHIEPNYQCGRDKASAIVKGALAESAKESMLASIASTPFMTLHFDTSNHNVTKLLPIVARFFDPYKGVCSLPIDMVTLDNETSETVANKIVSSVEKVVNPTGNEEQGHAKPICLCADNASVNFGGVAMKPGKNVATRLIEHYERDLHKVGCPAHSVNNGLRNAIKKLPKGFNIQTVVNYLFKEFQGQTLRVGKLGFLCQKHGLKQRAVLGSVVTRWLSLLRPLDNLIEMYPAISEYYSTKVMPKGRKVRPKVLFMKKFFSNPKSRVWLQIMKDLVLKFHSTIKTIEGDYTDILSCVDLIKELIAGCKTSAETLLFTHQIRQQLQQLSSDDGKALKKQAKVLYCYTAKYLHTWCKHLFVFEMFSWAKLVAPLGPLEEITHCIDHLSSRGISFEQFEGNLAFEYQHVRVYVEKNLEGWRKRDVSTVRRWVELFCSFKSSPIKLPNFELLIRFIFSISSTNAPVERIFSFINDFWSEHKSNLSFSNLLAAVITKFCLIERNDSSGHNYDNANAVWSRIANDPILIKRLKTTGKYNNHFTI